MKQRVSLITIGVADLQRSRRFYEALGWQPAPSPRTTSSSIQTGEMVVALWDRARLAKDSCVVDGGGWGGATLALNFASLAEVDAMIDEARAAAHDRPRAGRDLLGGYSGLFLDPDGHPWEVAHNPHWTLTEDGGVRLG